MALDHQGLPRDSLAEIEKTAEWSLATYKQETALEQPDCHMTSEYLRCGARRVDQQQAIADRSQRATTPTAPPRCQPRTDAPREP
mmetsp:Transcript_69516/g.185047  ORF Transcript_69516/g.185047 Transcript_69516/m.185047 type:complete len:85 (+) Transcript_69516:125-379(+)